MSKILRLFAELFSHPHDLILWARSMSLLDTSTSDFCNIFKTLAVHSSAVSSLLTSTPSIRMHRRRPFCSRSSVSGHLPNNNKKKALVLSQNFASLDYQYLANISKLYGLYSWIQFQSKRVNCFIRAREH